MKPRFGLLFRLMVHLGALHAALAALAFAALRERPWLLAVVEAVLVLSLVVAARLASALLAPLELLRTGAELLREGDYTTRFRPTGQRELDALARVYNDMADRLRAERARLVEQDLFLERLIAASPAGVITLDLDGRIVLVSPSAEALLGLRAADCAGRALSDVGTSETLALAALPSGGSRLLSRDGRTLRARRAEFHDRGFARTFFLVEELTSELEASERAAFERIVQVMAHEVRNSVGSVNSLLDSVAALARKLGGDDRDVFEQALGIATRRLLGLNSFMNAVSDVVRLPPPAKTDCDVGALLDDVVALMTPEAEARGIALDWSRGADVVLPLDKNQFEQALLNVLRNAFEATPPGGRVTVSLERSPSGPQLLVRDSGPGVPPQLAQGAFTPFFTTKPGGKGVGLMLVREVLQRHGLKFSFETHPRGGAELRVSLA